MKKGSITAILSFLIFAACESGDVIIVRCDSTALLLDQDTTSQVCGNYFTFFMEEEMDTVKIQYNPVLRDYFQTSNIDPEDYPISVYIEYTELPKGDPCREASKELVCIRRK